MAPIERDQKFQLRISTEERHMLERLAERQGVSASDVLRLWIRERYRDVFRSEPPK